MARVIYYFGTAQQLADSTFPAADKVAMTPVSPDMYQACPEGTKTIESKVESSHNIGSMIANSVNTSDIGAIPFDFLGQVINVSPIRTTYVKGGLGDIIICDDGT